jgi:hypothetical protein
MPAVKSFLSLTHFFVVQVCTSPDYAQPATAKNHYEVLRCFDCIG